ncbi:glycosyl hydrolase family 2 [Mucilaginibacter yixingensis]|uniref:Glycosyl hydrolase family 2 n=1 Tax=Mucilaginibacter yixingensis TaxID=1295612 RepID=A0A2T5J8I3_9SPHI|nr:malectin domain-containing carbohydrate-binding protein [Mucilaginibacter yixingensis]PTQ95760.1 glycosyl hydrolase family 2 [Mucilaginibacter yixingensis]
MIQEKKSFQPEGCRRKQRRQSGYKAVLGLSAALLFSTLAFAQKSTRQDISLNYGWHTADDEKSSTAFNGFEKPGYRENWQSVSVPHNWDQYFGYRRLKHGNLHGYAWYRKTFPLTVKQPGKRYFLYFEGVGSYATVWLNGQKVGYHAGGRTTFTIDVTDVIKAGKDNLLAVRADHPSFIKDLPWVCGGCSDDPGFSEGSQPMGIYRPVHLLVTNPVRVEPFGVHIWNDTTVTEKSATLNLETEVKNYSAATSAISVVNQLVDAQGKIIAQAKTNKNLDKNTTATIAQVFPQVKNVHLWSLENPYLYKVVTQVWKNGVLTDQTETSYGIRWISWPIGRPGNDGRFYLNGKPVFINGIAEYEHLMGKSQAFDSEEIRARVMQVKAAGFNAFRDAHQPHNLEYQEYWDKLGILWWPQYTAHIWYDTPEFRENFKKLLVDWVKERRNSPSNILWGLQNESRLPEAFAKECCDLIRKLDPTASSQRKITTCNGGKGTDWDVPQNWTGTYGGNPQTYSEDLKKELLVGEYGAWRSLDLHTEGGFNQNGPYSEDRMTQLMETKVRLGEAVKDKVAGQFQWLLYSHENPGRTQGGEGLRELDRVGPINYKGLFTPWGQPLDVFYMYRANYAPKDKEPMVYIVSHSWPNRWTKSGVKDSINIYSNCDEVELFNDVRSASLGRKKRGGIGTHFMWNKVDIKYNVLYAVGYVNGKEVAHDEIVLNHLPQAPHLEKPQASTLLQPAKGYYYKALINCGGPAYTDSYGQRWAADEELNSGQAYQSSSWTNAFPGMPEYFGSQQRTFDQVSGTSDSQLFQDFRYGEDKLKFHVAVPAGKYKVDLFFNEPWYGTGGGLNAAGWRVFSVAVNGAAVIKDLDIFKEAGYNHALKKTVDVVAGKNGINISFPDVKAGEAIISAIAISSTDKAAPVVTSTKKEMENAWLDIGQRIDDKSEVKFSQIPPALYGASWMRRPAHGPVADGAADRDVDLFVALPGDAVNRPAWLKDFEVTGLNIETDANGGTRIPLYRKRVKKGEKGNLGDAASNYFVIVQPVSSIEPASDLRKTASYSADLAELKNATVRDTVAGKKVVRFTQASGSSVSFPVTPGVADKYALRIKYYNFTDKTMTAKMQLLAADGLVMKEETLSFKPIAKGKSGTVATDSGTSINAGNYRVVVTAVDAEGLSLASVEMQ